MQGKCQKSNPLALDGRPDCSAPGRALLGRGRVPRVSEYPPEAYSPPPSRATEGAIGTPPSFARPGDPVLTARSCGYIPTDF